MSDAYIQLCCMYTAQHQQQQQCGVALRRLWKQADGPHAYAKASKVRVASRVNTHMVASFYIVAGAKLSSSIRFTAFPER